jgi:hypothetical protein
LNGFIKIMHVYNHRGALSLSSFNQ